MNNLKNKSNLIEGMNCIYSKKKILFFLILTFIFSCCFYALIISSGLNENYIIGLMWCPGIAAIITRLIFYRNVKNLGWKLSKYKYLLFALVLPIFYGIIVYGISWITGLGQFDLLNMTNWITQQQVQIELTQPVIIKYLLITTTLGMFFTVILTMGEEIGWRGFLVLELSKHTSFTKVAIISGVIWAIWHFPIILFSSYRNTATPLWFNLIFFTISIIGMSFVMTWLRLKSGSIWPAVILHASHNLFIQSVFDPLTKDTGITAYVLGEFGIGIAIILFFIAWLFWHKRSELPTKLLLNN